MSIYEDLFGDYNSCCGDPLPGPMSRIISEYYEIAFECMVPITDKVFAREIYGQPDTQKYYNMINEFHYLLGLLLIVADDVRLVRLNSVCGQADLAEILDDYDIDLVCIMNHFKCYGCKPSVLPRLFALFNIDITNFVSYVDGIGYMCIETCGPTCPAGPVNRVF